MKRTFIAYRSDDAKELWFQDLLAKVVRAFEAVGIEAYCTLFDSQAPGSSASKLDKMVNAFRKIGKSSFLFVVLASNDKSEGQLLEAGFACGVDVPIILGQRSGVDTKGSSLPDLARLIFPWEDADSLARKIRESGKSIDGLCTLYAKE